MTQKKTLKLPKLIGHRGVKDLCPENTLESILKAFNLGLSFVEIDVKISKDRVPILLHDDTLDRTTNGSGLAIDYDYENIKKLDAGKFFYKENTNIFVPKLEDILSLCTNNNGNLNIELKPNTFLALVWPSADKKKEYLSSFKNIIVSVFFTVLLAAIIAISIKMVGLLLITGMFIMPAAMARNLSNNPRQMVIISIIGGLLSVLIGLFSSLEFNTASGPSIITAALFLFILSLIKFKKNSELKQ